MGAERPVREGLNAASGVEQNDANHVEIETEIGLLGAIRLLFRTNSS